MLNSKLAILILSYNHPQLTSKAIHSIKNQNAKVYLLHNGSQADVVEALQIEFPYITHIVLPTNKMYAGGANYGLRTVLEFHQWCLFLTNDCELESFKSLPEQPGLYAVDVKIRSTNRRDSLGGEFWPEKAKINHIRDYKKRSGFFYVPGSAFVVDRDTFQASNGFDETLEMFWEDVDLSMRLKKLGRHVGKWDEIVVKHGIGKTTHKKTYYSLYLFQRNKKIVSLRYCANLFSKLKCGIHLYASWLRLSLRLLQQKRKDDLKLLNRAYWGH